jgi:hypothetical protein
MTDHPITPPPVLVEQWLAEIWHEGTPVRVAASDLHIATQSARWGADMELEACCEWLRNSLSEDPREVAQELRAARRPKPLSLKEQALERCNDYIDPDGIIRRALEALPND